MPKISVIMPVYNTKEDFLRQSINSMLAQTLSDFELLIIDDCSKANIKDIISSYTDKRIKYHRLSKNSGAAGARNYGLLHALGQYIAFLDADDISQPTRLEKQANFLDNNPKIGCLGTQVQLVGQSVVSQKPLCHDEIEDYLLFTGCIFCQSSVMIRADVIKKHNLSYNPMYQPAEDYAFWLSFIGKTQFAILDEMLTYYRWHKDNISHVKADIQLYNCFLAMFDVWENLYNIHFNDKALLCKYFSKQSVTPAQEKLIVESLKNVLTNLKNKPILERKIRKSLNKKIRKIYLSTKTCRGQYRLMTSSLNKLLDISLWRRIYYFITRGIL